MLVDVGLLSLVCKTLPPGWTCEQYSPGLPLAAGREPKKYAGRGWKEALVADAVAHLRPIDA